MPPKDEEETLEIDTSVIQGDDIIRTIAQRANDLGCNKKRISKITFRKIFGECLVVRFQTAPYIKIG